MVGAPYAIDPNSPQQRCHPAVTCFPGCLSQTLRLASQVSCMKCCRRILLNMGHTIVYYRSVPIRTPHVCCFQLTHTREGTSIWINVCEATTRRICTCFDALLMKVIRYTTDYGALYTKDVDHGSVVCHPVDETIPHHQSPFRYVHATKCQPYFGQKLSFLYEWINDP